MSVLRYYYNSTILPTPVYFISCGDIYYMHELLPDTFETNIPLVNLKKKKVLPFVKEIPVFRQKHIQALASVFHAIFLASPIKHIAHV